MLEYEVLENHKREYLEEAVAKASKAGWKLQGGVSVAMDPDGYFYAQAVVKESPDAKTD